MSVIFQLVYSLLLQISVLTGLTYKEVNILVFYLGLPLAFLLLIDRMIGRYRLTIGFTLGWVLLLSLIPSFATFSNQLFDLSVRFLNGFSIIGWNYTVASVMVCVILPGIAFLTLYYFAIRHKSKSLR